MYEIKKNSDFQQGATLTINVPGEHIDKKALYTLLEDKPSFTIPFKHRIVDGVYEFTYFLGENSRMLHIMGEKNKSEFLELWSEFLNPLFNYEDWFLNVNNFVFDFEHLYFNKISKKVMYLYVPTNKNYCNNEDLKNMITAFAKNNSTDDRVLEKKILLKITEFNLFGLRNVIKDSQVQKESSETTKELSDNIKIEIEEVVHKSKQKFKKAEKPNIINKIKQPFNNEEEISNINKIETPINIKKAEKITPYDGTEDINLSSINVSKKQSKKEKGNFFSMKKDKLEKNEKKKDKKPLFKFKNKKNNEAEILQNVSNYNGKLENNISYNKENYNEYIESQNNFEDGLTLLEDETPYGTYLGYIGHAMLPKTISVNIEIGSIFKIGRVDVTGKIHNLNFAFPKSTKAVSRNHALIERKEGGYYLTDVGSTAGTYINTKKLPINTEFKINTGDKIAFGTSGADYIWNEE